ncbi:putative endonuclease LCL3 [Porphyridium purpureum]|uniref:Putative endonuclease LCL3 n=1 Tax=Porphyridium purpureum TaxID=35688 RepID=A0A5J4YQS3_PORPP|nr:putative endonuclease LCL3 [Porphyridium purpureum]|eukprot:POR6121..scf296_7
MEYVEKDAGKDGPPLPSVPLVRASENKSRAAASGQFQLAFISERRTKKGRARLMESTQRSLAGWFRTVKDVSGSVCRFASSQFEPRRPLGRGVRSVQAFAADMDRKHPESMAALRTASCVLLAGIVLYALRRGFKVIRTADDLTPRMMSGRVRLRGVVASVGDGDNFRFAHEPLFRRTAMVTGKDAKLPRGWLGKNTIHVRLAGVDAPECAHFGQPGQKHGPEALAWLRKTLLNKKVTIRVFHRDQYQRAVSEVRYKPHWFSRTRDVSLELVKAGYGVVYNGVGEQHYGMKHAFMAAMEAAKKARKGMWRDGPNVLGPQEYKRSLKGSATAIGVGIVDTAMSHPRSGSFLEDALRWLIKGKPVQASAGAEHPILQPEP